MIQICRIAASQKCMWQAESDTSSKLSQCGYSEYKTFNAAHPIRSVHRNKQLYSVRLKQKNINILFVSLL